MSESSRSFIRNRANLRRDSAKLRLKRHPHARDWPATSVTGICSFQKCKSITRSPERPNVPSESRTSLDRRLSWARKKQSGLWAVLEHTLPPPQPTIESKNELRPRWPLVAVCCRQNLNATHGTPEVPPLVWYWKNPMSTEGGRTSQFSIKEREQPRGILTERLSFRVHHRHRRLLCSRRLRPHRGRAAEQRDTWSTQASSDGGTSSPSALRVGKNPKERSFRSF